MDSSERNESWRSDYEQSLERILGSNKGPPVLKSTRLPTGLHSYSANHIDMMCYIITGSISGKKGESKKGRSRPES